jgi:hypothetical protein
MPKPAPPKQASAPKPKKTSKRMKRLYWVGGGVLFFLLILMILTPAQGSLQYGICRVFVELSDPYPTEIKPLSVDDYVPLGGPVRIYYKKVDPFGVESVNTIECTFVRDATGAATTTLKKVDINGKNRPYLAESPEYIQKFNAGIPAILDNTPNLTLPYFSIDNISEYKDN